MRETAVHNVGLRIFYKKDTLRLLFTIGIIILNMFNIGNTQNLT